MKKMTSILAMAMAVVLCVGLMAGCTGDKEPENTTTQKPGTTTAPSKDEGKEENKGENVKPTVKPETQPAQTPTTKPEQGTTPDPSEPEQNATQGSTAGK